MALPTMQSVAEVVVVVLPELLVVEVVALATAA